MFSVNDILGPEGIIARRLARYEHRQGQLDMARAVCESIRNNRHLVVEAGTGVGKSFAYLVPAILYAVEEQVRLQEQPEHADAIHTDSPPRSKIDAANADLDEIAALENSRPKGLRRVVVSTHTISLQEQLITKDIPFLSAILPYEFSAVLVKGRSNYICLRRLENAARRTMTLFEDDDIDELVRINEWAKTTGDGSLSDLNPQPKPQVWDDVACEIGNCLGKVCPFEKTCFYQQSRRRIANAQLIIVNHAILFSDLAVRRQGGSLLPLYNALVFDEAHTMEQAAADHLGMSITQGQVDYLLNKLYNERMHRGLLARTHHPPSQEAVFECGIRASNFFENISNWLDERPGGNGRVHEPGIVRNPLTEGLRKLSSRLRDCIDKTPEQDQKLELTAARNKVVTLATSAEIWVNQTDDSLVYWVERFTTQRGKTRVVLEAAPVDVAPILREHMFNKVPSVIMTSATLSTQNAERKVQNA
ncbi:MAG: helicase, partial [Planctomycetaceae bacterium]|nr:helicase [Planctomycetaceae bacterium]